MSDNIPLEIQAEILKRLPIKSLIQFRSVSKQWKSLIDSSEFIIDFNLCHTEPHHLLVSYYNNDDEKYVSILDDNTFPQHKFPLTLPVSLNEYQFPNPIIIGTSQGLFCIYSYIRIPNVSTTNMAVIWNPCIRKSVVISVPNVLDFPYQTVIGFGVCPHTSDPKLVKFTYIHHHKFNTIIISSRVEICNSKSRVWRTISSNLPRKSIALTTEHVAINRFIYWLGYDRITVGVNLTMQLYNLIFLFDITNEEFTEEIYLPDSLAKGDFNLSLSKSRDCLVVIVTDVSVMNPVYDVWMMENGVPNSFRKLYAVMAPDASIRKVLGFRKSGEPIIDLVTDFDSDEPCGLYVYEIDTKQVSYIGISPYVMSCSASSYMESLLLLDH